MQQKHVLQKLQILKGPLIRKNPHSSLFCHLHEESPMIFHFQPEPYLEQYLRLQNHLKMFSYMNTVFALILNKINFSMLLV